MPKYVYDFEFLERGRKYPILGASIGVKCEDGREYYAVFEDFDMNAGKWHPFLSTEVIPHLPLTQTHLHGPVLDRMHPHVKPCEEIRRDLEKFYRLDSTDGQLPHVELWGYYSSYDHVVHSQIWGTMMDLPEGMPMYTRDIKQEMDRVGLTSRHMPERQGTEHHALDDARHQLVMLQHLVKLGVVE